MSICSLLLPMRVTLSPVALIADYVMGLYIMRVRAASICTSVSIIKNYRRNAESTLTTISCSTNNRGIACHCSSVLVMI
jgi:hypothetical protein